MLLHRNPAKIFCLRELVFAVRIVRDSVTFFSRFEEENSFEQMSAKFSQNLMIRSAGQSYLLVYPEHENYAIGKINLIEYDLFRLLIHEFRKGS